LLAAAVAALCCAEALPAGGSSVNGPHASIVQVSVSNGLTGVAILGAILKTQGATLALTDGNGQARVTLALGDSIEIDSPCITRLTTWRGDPSFRLWCQPEAFITAIGYSSSNGILTRPWGSVRVTSQDSRLRTTVLEQAARNETSANGGAVPFVLDAGDVPLFVHCDSRDPLIVANGWAAYTDKTIQNGWITSARVVLSEDVLRFSPSQQVAVLTHELGHGFGLGHHNFPGLMNPQTLYDYTDFTELESAAQRMVMVRTTGPFSSIGQIAPDDDRRVTTSLAAATSRRGLSGHVIVGCTTGSE
jgi:hypothetical protein